MNELPPTTTELPPASVVLPPDVIELPAIVTRKKRVVKSKKEVTKHYENPLNAPSIRAEKNLVETEYRFVTLKNLALYVDDDGNKSDGPAGIAVQTQIRIKKHFDEARVDFNEAMFDLLIALYRSLNRQINEMVRLKKSRPDIKEKIYSLIENYGTLARTEK